MTTRQLPKWVTPERQEYLISLWGLYGNRCLQGHIACPDITHYIKLTPKVVEVAKAVTVPCIDRYGNLLMDSEGKQLYVTAYKVIASRVLEETTTRLYDEKAESVIQGWIEQDREYQRLLWEVERQRLHNLNERRLPVRGEFSGIGKDIFYHAQPQYYQEGLSISGLTFKPFVKVRIASSYMHLFVDLGNTLSQVNKNKRRKAIRYGKTLPEALQSQVNSICDKAVKHYFKH